MNDKKLDKMKEEYGNMKIPNNLRDKIEQSIERAKKENAEETKLQKTQPKKEEKPMKETNNKQTNNKQNKKVILLIKRTAQMAAGFLLAITVAANTNAGIANAMGKIPVIGAITRVVTFRHYEVRKENVEADIKVPKVEEIAQSGENIQSTGNATQQINKSVEEYTNQIIAQFEANVAEFADYQGKDGGPHEGVFTDYEVIADTDTLFSLRINTTISKGGSANLAKIYHINKSSDTVITLKDIFADGADYVTIVSDNIKEQMRANNAADENLIYFLDSEEGMDEWDFKAIKEDANFYINKEGKLTIVFDEYEVAPGYMGIVEFHIPTEVLKDIVKEGYIN